MLTIQSSHRHVEPDVSDADLMKNAKIRTDQAAGSGSLEDPDLLSTNGR
jgi:hypothetical protein